MTHPGVLVISHGSRDKEWVRLVDEAVEAAASTLTAGGVPVVSSFLEIVEGRLIQDGIDELLAAGVRELLVLPLFVSSGSTHVDDIMQAFGQPPVSARRAGDFAEPFRIGEARIHPGLPIDDDPEIVDLLLANIAELTLNQEREALLLIGHGSREAVFHGRYRRTLKRLADLLVTRGGYARAETAMLLPDQAACRLGAMRRKRPDEAVIVVPLFLSSGYFTSHVIPSRLDGLEYRYNGRSMLPHPFVAKWMERQMTEWLNKLEGNG
ncbi:sirohydrochlorin chelatase [Paenibacillus beijingensis]|uniref:Cobalamin biosynthesis protein CbiX n=1 Tax=Paenibacillus beijingensis TaxID=1126833 RepID=A0A0D5NHD7_9BACL|nr:CbiX/SirB N-terminal domain-containing protein [Paenibacillus beijingensis]AJY74328.1 cobalamin biosynthesis protein CbiX [Paenibacillus beijingensis]